MARAIMGLLVILAAGSAKADDAALQEARTLYLEGKRQFEVHHDEVALHLFERAYEISGRPALLFDMAACLSALDRPDEAAARLRAYLVRVPDEPQRAGIETSIGELKARAAEQQAALREEREARQQSSGDAQRAALEARIHLLEEKLGTAAPPPHRRRNLAIGLGVGLGVVVLAGTALTLGLVLGRSDGNTPSSFAGGPLQATR